MTKLMTLDDVEVKGKTVLVRVDFNSPVDPETKRVLEDARIRAHAETTIKELAEKGAKVVIIAHQGRKGDSDYISLKQHAEILSQILRRPVKYVDDLYGEKVKSAIKSLKSGEILVLENVRTFSEETKDGTPDEQAKTELVKNLSPFADLFVNDAFSVAHRAHVSVVGFTPVLPSVAGRIMERELRSLGKVLEKPEKPCVFIFGGAKADDSLEISKYVLDNDKATCVLTGGIVAQLFLAAKNVNLGKPNMDLLERKELMQFVPGVRELINKHPEEIRTPVDLAIDVDGQRREIDLKELPTSFSISDIGVKTVEEYVQTIRTAKSILISGPMGKYENNQFELGTKKILEEIANSEAFSLAGGGHTISAIEEFGLEKKIGYLSTAGGALIEFLMGKELPGVAALKKASAGWALSNESRPH